MHDMLTFFLFFFFIIRNQSEEELTLPEFDDDALKELQNNVQETKTDIAEIEGLLVYILS